MWHPASPLVGLAAMSVTIQPLFRRAVRSLDRCMPSFFVKEEPPALANLNDASIGGLSKQDDSGCRAKVW